MRGVDPDGKALQTLTVFCFDRNGLLISTSSAKVEPDPDAVDNTEGKITVSVPIATRIMHLVGNQNMSRFDRNTFINKSEDEVLSILEGSAGMLIYWARVEVPANVQKLYADDVTVHNGYVQAMNDNAYSTLKSKGITRSFID